MSLLLDKLYDIFRVWVNCRVCWNFEFKGLVDGSREGEREGGEE